MDGWMSFQYQLGNHRLIYYQELKGRLHSIKRLILYMSEMR